MAITNTQYTAPRVIEYALGLIDADAIVYTALDTAGVTLSPTLNTITTQGTTDQYTESEASNYRAELDQQVINDLLNTMSHVKTTTSLPTGIASLLHGTGIPESVACELRVKRRMRNKTTKALVYDYVRFVNGAMVEATPIQTQGGGQNAIAGSRYVIEFTKATTYLDGDAISGVSAQGDLYTIERLT